MKQGDRVMVSDKNHPWYGYSGVLGELLNTTNNPSVKGMFAVELDNGMSAGCYLRQLEKL